MLTKLGCLIDESCKCTPASAPSSLPDATVGQAYDHSVKVEGTLPITADVLFTSNGLSASLSGDTLRVSGNPTVNPVVLLKLTNECTDCETFKLSGKLLDPCVGIEFSNPAPIPVSTPSAVEVTGSNVEVVVISAPDGASITYVDGFVRFASEKAGAYKAKLSNACSSITIDGSFAAEAAPPPCIPVSYKGETGSPLFKEGIAANYSILLNGTGPMTLDSAPEDLQAGLTYSLVETAGQWAIQITGTPQKLPCDDNAKTECKPYCFGVKNECGKTRVCKTLSYEGLDVTPKPVFCVGVVSVVPSIAASPNGFSCYTVTANFFQPDSSLFISMVAEDGSGTNASFTLAPAGQTSSDSEYEMVLDSEGAGEQTLCVVSSGSGCFVGQIYARHPVCGVVSRSAPVSSAIALLNDCFNSGGGGAP